MLFNSYIFIFIFLPVALLGYFGLNKLGVEKLSKAFLCGMSLWFYAYFNVSYLWIIVGSVLANFVISYLLNYARTPLQHKLGKWCGVLVNLGIFFYFKYYDFFFDNVNTLFKTSFALKHIALPLGISFFTFQQLSYIIDRANGKTKHYDLIDYLTFVTFFPQLIAGPIVLYSEMLPQFSDESKKRFQVENFAAGFCLFTIGLAKKVLLADVLARVANFGYAQTIYMDSLSTFLTVLFYTFQIYFDFSGYSDMAIGIGRMFNIDLPANFNSPYKACTVKEFWQRWHMTLSRFFVTYVYIPLGGSRKGRARTMLNTLIIFSLSGLWHGANWTYIAWGTLQGILVVWDNMGIVGVKGVKEKIPAKLHIPRWLGWILTMLFFMLSLVFFRSESMTMAFEMLKNLFAFRYTGFLPKLFAQLDLPEFYIVKQALSMFAPEKEALLYAVIFIILLIISVVVLAQKNALEIMKKQQSKYTTGFALWISVLFVWSVISFSQVSTFIYFTF